MIKFKCPFCNEVMEVSDKKLGQFVECIECGEMVEVKAMLPTAPRKKREQKDQFFGKDSLTVYEYLLYGAFCIFCPCISTIVCFVLEVMWVDDQPTKAYQITQLALILFVAHMTASCLIFSILLMLSDAGGGALCCIGSHLVVTGIAVAVKLLLLRK